MDKAVTAYNRAVWGLSSIYKLLRAIFAFMRTVSCLEDCNSRFSESAVASCAYKSATVIQAINMYISVFTIAG
jgi:hypothetical protein